MKKITRTKVNNALKKIMDQIDLEGEFVASIKIETTTFNEELETYTALFEDIDSLYASWNEYGLIYKVKIIARFGNGLGDEITFITDAYTKLKSI